MGSARGNHLRKPLGEETARRGKPPGEGAARRGTATTQVFGTTGASCTGSRWVRDRWLARSRSARPPPESHRLKNQHPNRCDSIRDRTGPGPGSKGRKSGPETTIPSSVVAQHRRSPCIDEVEVNRVRGFWGVEPRRRRAQGHWTGDKPARTIPVSGFPNPK
jgi:hypothetical protein